MATDVSAEPPTIAAGEVFRELERELHDLCQPVTSLQCRLELGKICGDQASLVEATEGALDDTVRIFEAVMRLRERLVAAREQAEKGL